MLDTHKEMNHIKMDTQKKKKKRGKYELFIY